MAVAVVATLTVIILMGGTNVAGEKKVEIKDVMKTAMKGGLCAKVAGGKASDAEKKQLVELFTALSKDTPPKGDADSWKTKTTALVDAAKKAAAGDADAGKALKAAANCMACHSAHKGK
jgi:hypothetical protein